MSDLDNRIAELRRRHAAAVAARAAAEVRRDTAQTRVAAVAEQLRTEFGVTTSDEARALLAKLHTELDEQAAALNAALDEIGRTP